MEEQARTCRWCGARAGTRYGGTLCNDCTDEAHHAEDNLGLHVLVRTGTWDDNAAKVDELKKAWIGTTTRCERCDEKTNIDCDICGHYHCHSHSGVIGFWDDGEHAGDEGPILWDWGISACTGCLQETYEAFRDRPETRGAFAKLLGQLVRGEVDFEGLTALK